jgi:hypothetical protein
MTENGTRAEGLVLEPRERGRLLYLMRRSDALGRGLDAYERRPHEDAEAREETLAILREEHEAAHREFMAYRRELGIPDRPRKRD